LLTAMQDVPDAQRQAAFHCVLVYLAHADDPTPIVCYGRWPGMIAREPSGQGGFGYDPIFYLPEQQKSAAEMSKAEK
ncbi:non-canonical purine NTP pyrophosphatase, partial [Rosenbergiella collisarenosi]